MAEHWFDRLSQELVRSTSRRQSVRLVALLVGGLVLGGAMDVAEAKKKPQKQKGKGKKANNKKGKGKPGKGKKPAPPPPRPDHLEEPDPTRDDCEAYLGSDDPFLNDCRQAEQTCRVPDHFCIWYAEGDQPGPADGATYTCCRSHETCCVFGCTDTRNDPTNCGSCGNECAQGELCLDGRCICGDPNGCGCPSGSNSCPSDRGGCCPDHPSWECCDDGCKFVGGSDTNNCGGCGVTCPRGQGCFDGVCRCNTGYKYCPLVERCVEEPMICCGGPGHPTGYCPPDMLCCGSGIGAYCIWPSQTC